jgi:hypothetical protein
MGYQSLCRLLIGSLLLLLMTLSEAAQEKVFLIELLNGKVTSAKTMQVKRFDTVRWKVKSNEAGELHLHAYHIEIPVSPDKVSEYVFKAEASGKFQLEWHPKVPSSTTHPVGHHEPLAFLEVYPQ